MDNSRIPERNRHASYSDDYTSHQLMMDLIGLVAKWLAENPEKGAKIEALCDRLGFSR